MAIQIVTQFVVSSSSIANLEAKRKRCPIMNATNAE
jgi:hypothetical protein